MNRLTNMTQNTNEIAIRENIKIKSNKYNESYAYFKF